MVVVVVRVVVIVVVVVVVIMVVVTGGSVSFFNFKKTEYLLDVIIHIPIRCKNLRNKLILTNIFIDFSCVLFFFENWRFIVPIL